MDIKGENIKIFRNTISQINDDAALTKSVVKSVEDSEIYTEKYLNEAAFQKLAVIGPATVKVTKNSSFNAARNYGGKIAVLNFASATNPGGGVTKGSTAQEECLCRCSTLYPVLSNVKFNEPFYKLHKEHGNALHNDDIIYSPNIHIIKSDNYNNLYRPFVVNVITCSRNEINTLLDHPDIKGITFVGSTPVGKIIYERAAKAGKRVQALCQAKNHALVLEDAPIERTVAGIINSAYGCAGQRCMALSACVVQESIADEFVAELKKQASQIKLGASVDKTSKLGPITYKKHYDEVVADIEKGVKEGATLVLDGRNPVLPDELKGGYFVGPTIFDNVTEEMTIGRDEVFGPVLCIKRVKDFNEGLKVMNANPYANGSVIFTQNGHYAREFTRHTDGGMVGVNVGIPVPVGFFPFAGHKDSFFGDLHCLGKDAYRFFTESKCVTTRWFDEEEMKKKEVSTWDGTI